MQVKKMCFGAVVLVTTVCLNLQFAIADYDFGKNGVQDEILQCTTTSSDGSSGTGTGTGTNSTLYTRIPGSCTWSGTSSANASISIGALTIKADKDGKWSYTADKAEVRCTTSGGEVCIPQNCPSTP